MAEAAASSTVPRGARPLGHSSAGNGRQKRSQTPAQSRWSLRQRVALPLPARRPPGAPGCPRRAPATSPGCAARRPPRPESAVGAGRRPGQAPGPPPPPRSLHPAPGRLSARANASGASRRGGHPLPHRDKKPNHSPEVPRPPVPQHP